VKTFLKIFEQKNQRLVFACLLLFSMSCTNSYMMRGIKDTYLKGRLTPDIDGYSYFANRTVSIGKPQPWPVSSEYNKDTIPRDCLDFFKKHKTEAYLIIRNDSILYEQYWDGYSDTSHTNSFSSAKSITSILAGIAISEGKIKSIHQRVSDFIPSFNKGMDSLLTIENLLTMSSSINFNENYYSPFGYPAKAYYGTDLMKMTLKYKVTSKPGRVFNYMSGNSAILGYVVSIATGEKLSDYAAEKLWQPIGAEHPAYWSLDKKDGMEKAYCCFNSNARDFARLGKLYLDSGKWNGKQIVPKEYVIASITPKLTAYYGYNWWITRYGKHYVPYTAGLFGQYVYVIADENMVVVRLGKLQTEDDDKYYVGAAIRMYGKKM
jgi:CubicO group peptidase (beta-lactamase class C family)